MIFMFQAPVRLQRRNRDAPKVRVTLVAAVTTKKSNASSGYGPEAACRPARRHSHAASSRTRRADANLCCSRASTGHAPHRRPALDPVNVQALLPRPLVLVREERLVQVDGLLLLAVGLARKALRASSSVVRTRPSACFPNCSRRNATTTPAGRPPSRAPSGPTCCLP